MASKTSPNVHMGAIAGGEARKIYKSNPIILLPMGSHEDQGPHAPMGDWMLTEILSIRAAERANAIAAPTMPFGWADFFREVGCPDRRLNVRRFNSHVIALQAARSGHGVVLGWASLVTPLLESGDLVHVSDAEVPAPHAYYVTWSARRPMSPQATVLRNWLLSLCS